MPIIRAPRPERDFTVISNRILNDPKLSWAARGILVHLLSKPDHWNVNVQALINETRNAFRSTGRDAVYKLIDELIDARYATRRKHANGTTEMLIYEEPLPENTDVATPPDPENTDEGAEPNPEKPDPEKPDPENQDVLVRTDKAVRTEELEKTDLSLKVLPPSQKNSSRKGSKITLKAFLAECSSTGELAIRTDDPIFNWAKITRVSDEMLSLAWHVFKGRFLSDESKRQIDWRAHYRNAVKNSWFHLWYFDAAGECRLTTAGVQADREFKEVV
jgi:hypothetical protein